MDIWTIDSLANDSCLLDWHLRLSGNADDSTFTSLFKDTIKEFNFEISMDEKVDSMI